MELFSQHNIEFDIVKQQSDIYHSVLNKYDNFTESYKKLFDIIGYNHFIWCKKWVDLQYSKDNKIQEFSPVRIWCLDVPEKHIICVNREMWDCFLLNSPYITENQYKSIFDLGGDDLYEKIYDLVDKEKTWKNIIKNKNEWDHYDDYLIPSPVKSRWVQRTYIVTAEREIG